MAQYAKNTTVSSELSRIEIEKVLIRYGANNFAYANGRHPERGGFENLTKEAVHIAASAISFLDCIRKNFDETGTKKGTAGFRST